MDMSVRPPRVLTRSFPLMTVPYTAGAPCSYWTLTCLAVSSALHSLMGFLFVSPVVCSRLPSDFTSRWTPLPFSYPFPTAGQGRDFHPIERAPAGRTKKEKRRHCRLFSFFHSIDLVPFSVQPTGFMCRASDYYHWRCVSYVRLFSEKVKNSDR